eukprot:TRINITY_DN3109_c0_g1_i1.p1 TRINITY_DN3109_c0_g1~~TRINITY_DN3109_c0_g1_i1.p1  ORF type:complete len:328 (-),score=61.89 TRINITY_DN3109_c0_g1_i1:320-1303(-)
MAAAWDLEMDIGSSDESGYGSSTSSSDGEGNSWAGSARKGLVVLSGLAMAGCLLYAGPSILAAKSAPLQPHPSAREELAISDAAVATLEPSNGVAAVATLEPSNGVEAVAGGVPEPALAVVTSTTMPPAAARVPLVPPAPEAPAPLQGGNISINKRRRPLKPQEHMHDGDLCDDTEEMYGGLCYTKCSILTGLPEARRSTAFSCCPTSDCHGNVLKMKTASLLPCKGYDVSSSDGGIACPHIRGECLTDEEQFMGDCFEKCSKITGGKFPKRIAAATCCNPDGDLGCLNFHNDDTNAKLNLGGGGGDHDGATPRGSHLPLLYLTEKK